MAQMHAAFQEDALFQLAAVKSRRVQALCQRFQSVRPRKLWLGAHLKNIGFAPDGLATEHLPSDFFRAEDATTRQQKVDSLEDCIVLLNNNDIGKGEGVAQFPDFVERCPHTVFLIWDLDNHHWLQLSPMLAAFADLYIPTHSENLYFLSRYNWNIAGPVACGTIQWTREFLTHSLPQMLQAERSDQPLGMHFYYPQFPFRNRSVVTLRQHFARVDFSSAEFHQRSEAERFAEWCAHQSHWVIPVLNDVPIRIFDALSTGGIPIVPASLRYLFSVGQIPRDWIVFYDPEELLRPESVARRASAAFMEGGAQGIVARHRYALENHHGENSLARILAFAVDRFGLRLGA